MSTLIFMSNLYDVICFCRSLRLYHIVYMYSSMAKWFDDNVMSKLLRNHDVKEIATHVVWITQYKSSNRENLFFNSCSVENQFNQLVRQFSRGRRNTYRVRLWQLRTRWLIISIYFSPLHLIEFGPPIGKLTII